MLDKAVEGLGWGLKKAVSPLAGLSWKAKLGIGAGLGLYGANSFVSESMKTFEDRSGLPVNPNARFGGFGKAAAMNRVFSMARNQPALTDSAFMSKMQEGFVGDALFGGGLFSGTMAAGGLAAGALGVGAFGALKAREWEENSFLKKNNLTRDEFKWMQQNKDQLGPNVDPEIKKRIDNKGRAPSRGGASLWSQVKDGFGVIKEKSTETMDNFRMARNKFALGSDITKAIGVEERRAKTLKKTVDTMIPDLVDDALEKKMGVGPQTEYFRSSRLGGLQEEIKDPRRAGLEKRIDELKPFDDDLKKRSLVLDEKAAREAELLKKADIQDATNVSTPHEKEIDRLQSEHRTKLKERNAIRGAIGDDVRVHNYESGNQYRQTSEIKKEIGAVQKVRDDIGKPIRRDLLEKAIDTNKSHANQHLELKGDDLSVKESSIERFKQRYISKKAEKFSGWGGLFSESGEGLSKTFTSGKGANFVIGDKVGSLGTKGMLGLGVAALGVAAIGGIGASIGNMNLENKMTLARNFADSMDFQRNLQGQDYASSVNESHRVDDVMLFGSGEGKSLRGVNLGATGSLALAAHKTRRA